MKPFAIGAVVVGLSMMVGIGSASDGAMTVGDLQEICTATDAVSRGQCRMYILGIGQGIQLGMAIADGKTQGGRPCVPEDTPAFSMELIVKKTIGEDLMFYPKDRDLYASGFVGASLIKAYPCRKAK